MEWSDDSTLFLIDLYKSLPVLWNPNDPGYYRRSDREDAWVEISKRLMKPAGECKNKLIKLLSSYRRERSRVKNSMLCAGQNNSRVYKSRWFAYKSFLFLEDKDNLRPKKNADRSIVNENKSKAFDKRGVKRSNENNNHCDMSSSSEKAAKIANVLISAASSSGNKGIGDNSADDRETKYFCSYLASKMMSYSSSTKTGVQHAIYDILIKADKGLFDKNPVLYGDATTSSDAYDGGPQIESLIQVPIKLHTIAYSPSLLSPNLDDISSIQNIIECSQPSSPSYSSKHSDDMNI